jgi:hypothetical protein
LITRRRNFGLRLLRFGLTPLQLRTANDIRIEQLFRPQCRALRQLSLRQRLEVRKLRPGQPDWKLIRCHRRRLHLNPHRCHLNPRRHLKCNKPFRFCYLRQFCRQTLPLRLRLQSAFQPSKMPKLNKCNHLRHRRPLCFLVLVQQIYRYHRRQQQEFHTIQQRQL